MIKLKLDLPFEFLRGLNDMLRQPAGYSGQGYGITKSKKKKIHDYLAKVVGNTKISKGSTAVIIEYNTTPKDVDNVAACCKEVFDALKEIGVIEDDNREWLPILMASTCKVKTMPERHAVLYFLDHAYEGLNIINERNDVC